VDFHLADEIARAILYEGYLLYPYRTSSLKNCRPFSFGALYPKSYCQANGDIEPWSMQIECLVRGADWPALQGAVRFLHGRGERTVALPERALHELTERARIPFSFPDDAPQGCVELSAERSVRSVFKLRVRIDNETPLAGADQAMLSTHAILGVRGGRFLSLIDPPADMREVADRCQNRGAWPVLVGDRARQDMMLAAPIILYDFPQIAPESPGNLFDGTEIDELLTLRILTLTDAEKQAMRTDDRTCALLERTEALSRDQRLALHGAFRRPGIKPGDRVRIRPQGHADVLDLVFDGKSATVVGVEQDFEGRIYYTVTMDDDPGLDLGREGKPGHRFFFRCEELEPLSGDA
jgi:hypothetical protein